jgi:hypothetical protein
MPLFSAAGPFRVMNRKWRKSGLHQLRHDHLAIEGREGGVVDVGAVVVAKANEAGVLDAVALGGRGREKDALG